MVVNVQLVLVGVLADPCQWLTWCIWIVETDADGVAQQLKLPLR